MIEKLKDVMNKKNLKEILIIFFISLFVSIPLISNNIDMFYDDGIQHVARIIGTMQSIEEKQVFPVIMSKYCNNFGYSWNLFYSPLTAYMPLIFRIIGLSYINCIKMFMLLVVFLSGIAMYFFTKEITKNEKIALLSAAFYILAPYRLTDMYARNALAELTSFIFLPMIFMRLVWNIKFEEK